ncbi:hypothetical protein Ga0466249_004813 [Sporomusaceae bacterium BoRhaA]|uniref:hypothetical protein n=1 Tax=Pelorhabdus rhamnosifermentans TaxID=2772457 RepID=UPI001C060463|nr:hypothetical protein [Pelorhabdus rhamnosifermentans]MBU2703665.1 hypothetical protein [Pelorhabdus rhamnosifermentans]
MNTYKMEVRGLTTIPYQAVADTPGQAKYQCYKYFTDELSYDLGFDDFFKRIEYCRKIGGFKPRDLFGDWGTFDRMKQARDIEFAYMGMRIEVCGKRGTIVGSNSSLSLDVVMDGTCWTENCHPWYRTKYFDRKGNVIREFKN